jgi:hypothetical protein
MVRDNVVQIAGALHQRTLSLRYGASHIAWRTANGDNHLFSLSASSANRL